MKTKKIMLFGGISPEHDISIITACGWQDSGYEKIYLDKQGGWHLISGTYSPADFANKIPKSVPCTVKISENILYRKRGKTLIPLFTIDYALLCFHGGNGEKGDIQSLLEICGIPYSGSNPAASQICFDKWLCKVFLRGLKLPTVSGIVVNCAQIPAKISYPVVVKPCCGGSSIGIAFAQTQTELTNTISTALCYDTKVLIERKIENAADLNIAVLKNGNDYIVSPIEQANNNGFYSFENKYSSGNKDKTCFIHHQKEEQIRKAAIRIAKTLGIDGVCRIDILTDKERYYINEINTIPGSLAYHLFERVLSRKEFLSLLEKNAKEQQALKNKLCRSFCSSVLSNEFHKKK